jgi:hypothetical protein
MTRVDGIHHIVSLIQAEAARRTTEPAKGREGKRNENAVKGHEGEIADRLRLQLAAVERDAPDRRRRILRALVESALIARFGETMLLDPAFFRMLDDVQLQMEGSPEISRLVDDAVRVLGYAAGSEGKKP